MGGVEINPGPRKKGSSSAPPTPKPQAATPARASSAPAERAEKDERKSARAGEYKKRAGAAQKAVAQLVDQMRADGDRRQAEDDLKDDAKEADRLAKIAADVAFEDGLCHDPQLMTFLDRFKLFFIRTVAPENEGKPFLPFDVPYFSRALTFSSECAVDADSFSFTPLPFFLGAAYLTGLEPILLPDAEGEVNDLRLRQTRHRSTKVKGPVYVLNYTVRYTPYSCGRPICEDAAAKYEYATVHLEDFMYCRKRGFGRSGLFLPTLEAVANYLQISLEINRVDYSTQTHSIVSLQVLTSLLLLEGRSFGANPALVDILSGEAGRRACSVISGARPLAEGTYVVGYDAPLDVVFPGAELAQEAGIFLKPVRDAAYSAYRKSMNYCVLSPIHISGLLPTFPNPFSRENRLCGYFKRLQLRRGAITADNLGILKCYADALSDGLPDIDNVAAVTHQALVATCGHVKEKGFKGMDAVSYLAGVLAAWRNMNLPYALFEETLRREFPQHAELVREVELYDLAAKSPRSIKELSKVWYFGGFIKAETYDPDAIKAPRNIIAPNFHLRGYSHLLLYVPQHRFFEHHSDISVKGLTAPQIRDKTLSKFKGCNNLLETDFTSMESNVQAAHVGIEFRVITRFSPQVAQGAVEELGRFFSQSPCVSFSEEVLLLPAMRLSGTEQTSLGNFILNTTWCRAIIADASAVMSEHTRADPVEVTIVEELYEGDDGLIALSHPIPKDVLSASCRKFGVLLKFEEGHDVASLNFCGNNLEEYLVARATGASFEAARLQHPLDVLSRLFCIFHPPGGSATTVGRDKLLAAKAFSYLSSYPTTPIVAPICTAVLNRLECTRAVANEIAAAAAGATQGVSGPIRKWVADMRGKDRLSALLPYLTSTRFPDPVIPPALRARVASTFHLPEAFQLQVERDCVDQIKRGVTTVVCPQIEEVWLKMKGVAGMTAHTFNDARTQILPKVQSGVSVAQDCFGGALDFFKNFGVYAAQFTKFCVYAAVLLANTPWGLAFLSTLGSMFAVYWVILLASFVSVSLMWFALLWAAGTPLKVIIRFTAMYTLCHCVIFTGMLAKSFGFTLVIYTVSTFLLCLRKLQAWVCLGMIKLHWRAIMKWRMAKQAPVKTTRSDAVLVQYWKPKARAGGPPPPPDPRRNPPFILDKWKETVAEWSKDHPGIDPRLYWDEEVPIPTPVSEAEVEAVLASVADTSSAPPLH